MPATPRRIPALVVAVTSAVAAFGLAAPAQAESHTYRDAVKDVIERTDSHDRVRARATDPDIVRTRTAHGLKNIVVRTHLRELGYGAHQLALQVKTPRQTYVVRATKGGRPFANEIVVVDNNGTRTCDGARFRLDRDRATMTLSLPRRCVGSPRWVRLGVSTMAVSLGGVAWVDDSRGRGLLPNEQLRMGPRLLRG